MAQIIKNRRGSINNVKDVTTQNAEILIASGSISDLSGPFILYGSPTVSDSGLTGVYKPASKIYQGANVPTIAVGTYGNVLDGTPFYSSASKALYILNAAGNTLMDLAGNLSGSVFPNIIASGSFSGSFQGNGSGLTNISASSIVGLNLSRISTGSVTSSVNIGTTTFQVVSSSVSLLRINNNKGLEFGEYVTASGEWSHAEGGYNQASGLWTHAEGQSTIALGTAAHAEGDTTQAIGDNSHAEGNNTIASGYGSHAEGYYTQAIGNHSHAEGSNTISSGSYQHVQGTYNIPNDTSLMIIGNGNALTSSNVVDVKINSVEITGSLKVTAGITGSLFGTSSYALQALSSSYALNATSASYALQALSSSYALNSSYALSSSYALTASYIASASYTPNLQEVTNKGATTTNALTMSGAFINGSAVISGNLDVNGTITYISSSTLQIGDNIIEINYNKAAGNSGMIVYDTTAPFTASMLWNATADRWMAGPYGSESIIILTSDTASMSVASSSVAISSSYALTSSYNLQSVSASYALTASYYGGSVVSASYASTASYVTFAQSASYVQNAQTASYVNILNQNVIISGSLTVTNSISTPVVNTPLVQNGSQQFVQDTNTSITAIVNGANTWGFYPGGQFYPAGPIAGSSYGSNQLILTNTSPAQLKGTIYGVQIVTSPDQEVTSSYTWDFKTNGDLVLPSGKYITGSLFGTASYATNAATASYLNPLSQSVILTGSIDVTDRVNLNGPVGSGFVTGYLTNDGNIFRLVGGNELTIENVGVRALFSRYDGYLALKSQTSTNIEFFPGNNASPYFVLYPNGTASFAGNLVVTSSITSTTGFYDGTGTGAIQFAYLNASKQLSYLSPSTSGDLIQWNGSAMTASNLIDGGTF
jgi:hypothetical protein